MSTARRFSILSGVLTLTVLCLFGSTADVHAQETYPSSNGVTDSSSWSTQPKYKPDEILVRFRPGTSQEKKNLAHSAARAEQVKSWASVEGLHLVRVSAGVSIKDAIRLYKRRAEVLYAEPNYYVHAFTTPNDPKFPQLWGLQNTGQLMGTPGADIHATQAWNITTGSSSVVVAVIDTGMDYTHEDLSANAWSSSATYSLTVNGVTINCPAGSRGFNAVSNTCDPMDDNGHGTHVSGTIGATGNNGVGVVGVNWSVRILPCKFLDSSGGGTTDAAVTCLDFVKSMKDQGEKIVATNNSWGGGGFSQALSDAVQAQQQDGILFVAAAGNDSADNDLGGFYPAGFFLPNVVSVAATTRFDWLANFSNFGNHSVSLGAPGQEVLSTFPNNSYAWLSGTSMATPHVTGVAALLAAQDPSRDWRAIKNLLIAGGDSIPALASNTISGKRLNAFGSMTCSNSTVSRRLQPTLDTIVGSAGMPILLAALNINCAQPVGPVTVTVTPGNQTFTLVDNGTGQDQAAQDGIYTGQWTPPGVGNYNLTFSTGESVQVTVLTNYVGGEAGYNYQTITGTNLNLGDDEVATLNLPFSVQFGGAGFSTAYVSSNGTISFTNAFDDFLNFSIPVNYIEHLNIQNPPPPDILQPVVTLVAPYWMDLYPVKGSNQNVFWSVTGTAPNRQLILEWRNVRSFACRTDSNTNVTFEVVFSESSSNVVFNYANATFGNACANEDDGQVASIGIQVSQDVGTQWGGPTASQYIPGQGFNQPTVTSGMTLQWTLVNPNAPPNPSPVVTSISPASVPAGSPDVWLTLNGTGFVPDSQCVSYGGPTRVTKYISSTQVQVLFGATELLYPSGTPGIQINITNPTPGGGTSPSVYLLVTQQNPVITSISPTSIPAGSFGFNLTVNGSGFIPFETDLLFNGGNVSATTVSSTQAVFPITGPLVQTAGTVNVQLQVGQSTSNTLLFTITPATSPATLQAPTPAAAANGTQADAKKLTANLLASRFLGRKAAQFLGPSYTEKFQRQLSQLSPAARQGVKAAYSASPAATAALTTLPPVAVGFSYPPSLPAGFLPTAVVSGDFNGDGKLDWAVANGGDDTIWIYLGNGDGTAKLPTIVRLQGSAPVALAVADMNGDGKLDLVVAEADSLSVAVLLGNGDGTFGPELTFATPSLPISLAVADFNGDGKLDVVVGLLGDFSTGQLAFLPGDGTGKLGTPIIHYGQGIGAVTFTFSVVAADLNGDGLPDIVAVDYLVGADGLLVTDQVAGSGAHIFLNRGDGIFKLTQEFFQDASVDQSPPSGVAATAIAVADVNKDGCIDAVTLDSVGSATFFPGLCNGTFDTANARIFGSGIVADVAQLSDVNGDGKLDLVSSSFSYGSYNLLLDMPSSAVSVQFGDGAGNFGAPALYRGEPYMAALAVADLKKNGRPEVITANQQTSTVTVFQNDGAGGFGQPKGGYVGYLQNGLMHAIGNAPASDFAVVDLNADGHPDLATIEYGSQFPLPAQMTVLLNNGTGGFGAPIRTPIALGPGNATDFVFGDFRNTGRKDLLFIAADLQSLQIDFSFAAGNGDGTFQKPVQATAPLTIYIPLRIAVGDFNRDGKLDFLVVGAAGYMPFFGNGDGTFTPGPSTIIFPPNTSQGAFIRGVQVADVNGDGKLDLLLLGSDATTPYPLYVALGNGDGTFQAPSMLPGNFGPFAVVDLNKDGHPDIIAAVDGGMDPNIFGHLWTYKILLGNGDGTFTPGQTYGPFPNPYADFYYREYFFGAADHPLGSLQPMIGDFNGDGIPDLAVYTTGGTNFFNAVGFAGGPLDTELLVLAGNGDGTFSVPSFGQPLGGLLVPQKAADLNGDGLSDLLELNAYTSSYTILSAKKGAAFSVGLISNPVIGSSGNLLVLLMYPSNSATTLQLSASDSNISIPTSITIPAGTVSQVVPFQIGASFDSSKVFGLTAQLGTESHTAYGTQATAGQNVGFVAVLQYPAAPPIAAGQTTGDYGLLVGSIGGYSTQITTTCVGLPTGASCQVAPNPVQLPEGGGIAISLKVSTQTGMASGQYSFTVNVTDGALSRNLAGSFDVGDFSMSVTPSSQTLGATDFTSYTLNIQGIAGFSQPIQVTCSGLPNGTTCPFSGTLVFPGANSFQIHTQNTPAGTYTFTLTGTSSGITRTATAQMVVTSGTFSGSVSPSSATITVGSSQTFNVQLNSSGGFQGQVNLNCVAPSSVVCQFSSSQVSLTTGGTASTSLTIKVNSKPATALPYFLRILRWFNTREFWNLLYLIPLILFASGIYRHLRRGNSVVRVWSFNFTVLVLFLAALSMSSCGGGGAGTGGGGGGGGGGGATVINVTVQGTTGGSTVTLGTVQVSVP